MNRKGGRSTDRPPLSCTAMTRKRLRAAAQPQREAGEAGAEQRERRGLRHDAAVAHAEDVAARDVAVQRVADERIRTRAAARAAVDERTVNSGAGELEGRCDAIGPSGAGRVAAATVIAAAARRARFPLNQIVVEPEIEI